MLHFLYQVFLTYWQVLCFKRSPKDTPNSILMLGVAFLLSLGITALQMGLALGIQDKPGSLLEGLIFPLVQVLLFWVYLHFILWVFNKQKFAIIIMTNWLMMLFFLDSMALLFMLLIVGIKIMSGMAALTSIMMYMSIFFGLLFSIWQVSFSVQLLKTFIEKPLFQVGFLYLGWIGINFLLILAIKQLFHMG
jgi:hypothetical protein